jgi:aspartate aminotransferase
MTSIPLTFPPAEEADAGLSTLARGIVGSEILRIAAQIRAMKASGAAVCNLTVGDFDPAYFPIPAELLEWTRAALADGQTNYPPSDGVPVLREAVTRYYERELGLSYPVDSVLIAGGARPLIYGAYRTLLDPGDVAVFPVPSWNNNHYCRLTEARPVMIPVHEDHNFFPTDAQLRPYLSEARIVMINSPLNPTGTVIAKDELRKIAVMIVEENRRRARSQSRPVFLVYDQVYWALTFGDATHVTPVELVPEIAPYTLMLDAASKSLCATGLRVGWAVMPPYVRKRMADILGHVGAWAPKAEQIAVAKLLDAPAAIGAFQAGMKAKVKERLDALYDGFMAVRREGLPVDAIVPQGAIYLSVRFDLFGKTFAGSTIQTNDDIRKMLLTEAGIALVPFQAFGLQEDSGWFRISVGAVSVDEVQQGLARLRQLMTTTTRAR